MKNKRGDDGVCVLCFTRHTTACAEKFDTVSLFSWLYFIIIISQFLSIYPYTLKLFIYVCLVKIRYYGCERMRGLKKIYVRIVKSVWIIANINPNKWFLLKTVHLLILPSTVNITSWTVMSRGWSPTLSNNFPSKLFPYSIRFSGWFYANIGCKLANLYDKVCKR